MVDSIASTNTRLRSKYVHALAFPLRWCRIAQRCITYAGKSILWQMVRACQHPRRMVSFTSHPLWSCGFGLQGAGVYATKSHLIFQNTNVFANVVTLSVRGLHCCLQCDLTFEDKASLA